MKLFAIYIGGEFPGANIEVHDMRFLVADSIKETYPELLRQWWGAPGSLHIDCWAEMSHVDGYDITLRPEPFEGTEKLFFVNLGGYEPGDFSERHRNFFIVANSPAEAKSKSMALVERWIDLHVDELYDAGHIFCLNGQADIGRMHIHLEATGRKDDSNFIYQYIPIKGDLDLSSSSSEASKLI